MDQQTVPTLHYELLQLVPLVYEVLPLVQLLLLHGHSQQPVYPLHHEILQLVPFVYKELPHVLHGHSR